MGTGHGDWDIRGYWCLGYTWVLVIGIYVGTALVIGIYVGTGAWDKRGYDPQSQLEISRDYIILCSGVLICS